MQDTRLNQRTKYRVIELNLAGEPLVYEFNSKPNYKNAMLGFVAEYNARDLHAYKKLVDLRDESIQRIKDVVRHYLNNHPMSYRAFETEILSNFISNKQYVYETIEELDKFLNGLSNTNVQNDQNDQNDQIKSNLDEMNLQEMILLRDELNKRIASSNVHVSVDFDLPAGAYAFKMRENGEICVDWVQGGFSLFRLEIDSERIEIDSDHIKLKPKLVKL